jgi:hypothetical protein
MNDLPQSSPGSVWPWIAGEALPVLAFVVALAAASPKMLADPLSLDVAGFALPALPLIYCHLSNVAFVQRLIPLTWLRIVMLIALVGPFLWILLGVVLFIGIAFMGLSSAVFVLPIAWVEQTLLGRSIGSAYVGVVVSVVGCAVVAAWVLHTVLQKLPFRQSSAWRSLRRAHLVGAAFLAVLIMVAFFILDDSRQQPHIRGLTAYPILVGLVLIQIGFAALGCHDLANGSQHIRATNYWKRLAVASVGGAVVGLALGSVT